MITILLALLFGLLLAALIYCISWWACRPLRVESDEASSIICYNIEIDAFGLDDGDDWTDEDEAMLIQAIKDDAIANDELRRDGH